MRKKILIVAAHPDDEILGCGGTVARLIRKGHEAFTLILGEGVTSRSDSMDRAKNGKALSVLKREAMAANKIIGVKSVMFYDFPDNRFDTVPFLDIVKAVETVKRRIKPEIVFTHYEKDLNIDHQITYSAVVTATRPLEGESVKEIYSYETLSSTEWSYPFEFSPDTFFDITGTIKGKVKAMRAYRSELRKYPHPRSPEGIKLGSKNWGMKSGVPYAEAFKAVRIVK